MRRILLLCSLAAIVSIAQAGSTDPAALVDGHELFGLRSTLREARPGTGLAHRYYSALVAAAFGDQRATEARIAALLGQTLPSGWRRALLRARMDVRLRDFDYAGALADARALAGLREPGDPPSAGDEAANMAALLAPLKAVPAQSASPVHRARHIRLRRDAAGGYCVPVAIGASERCFAFDTGANFSILIRSQAKALGLRIRPAGARIGTSTGGGVHADLAVAPMLKIGSIVLHHVVFLVLPDAAMTFPGARISGLLGFPVLRGLGRVRFNADHSLDVLAPRADAAVPNIALDGQQPLVQVVFKGDRLLCALDSGAARTVFYKRFYQRYGDWAERSGYRHQVRLGGAGGIGNFAAVRIPEMQIAVAGKPVDLHSVDVFVHDIRPDQAYLMCNIGLDALEAGTAYTVDFRHQTLQLE